MDFQVTNYFLHLAAEPQLLEQGLLNNSDMPPEIRDWHFIEVNYHNILTDC